MLGLGKAVKFLYFCFFINDTISNIGVYGNSVNVSGYYVNVFYYFRI